MAKEKKEIKTGDKIVTKRNGEIIGAIVTAVDGKHIAAVQIVGEEFRVEGEFIPLAD
jgi:hypothetical protein